MNGLERLAGLKPAEVLNCFLDVWNNTPFRDTTSRLFRPGNRGKWYKIVVAGDMSWGDDPDGAGYQTINEARLLGLFPLLGVR